MHLLITVKPLIRSTEWLFGEKYYVITLMAKSSKYFFYIYDNAKSCVKAGGDISVFLVVCQVFTKVKICPQSCSRCT